jgi:hypothetical protein
MERNPRHPGAVLYIFKEGDDHKVKRIERGSKIVTRERWLKIRAILRSYFEKPL